LALFVILAGILLIMGGGISLLAGFDIVMTERGSAMTIGGTVALAGGAITLGIGFALLRLSQILRVLQTVEQEETAPEPAAETTKPVLAETVVAPATVETLKPDVIAPAPVIQAPATAAIELAKIEDDTILVSPLKPREVEEAPKKPGFFKSRSKMAGIGTSGIGAAGAAGAAILASSTALAGSEKDEKTQPSEVDLLPPLPEITSPQMKEEPLLDLEAELSRALAEDIPATVSQEEKTQEEKTAEKTAEKTVEHEIENIFAEATEQPPLSFNEGLSQVLSKPKKRGKRGAVSDASQETSSETDLTTAEISEGNDAPFSSIDVTGLPSSAVDRPSDPVEELLQQVSKKPSADARSEDLAEPTLSLQREGSALEGQQRPAILGTYNAGDGTYVMYADGTVEAINEQGVRLFKSMEELRAHLAKK
jgi:hypothetical protein